LQYSGYAYYYLFIGYIARIDNIILQRGWIFLHVRTKITKMVNKILRCSTHPSQCYLHMSIYTCYTCMTGCAYTRYIIGSYRNRIYRITTTKKSTTHIEYFIWERVLILAWNEITELHLNCPQRIYIRFLSHLPLHMWIFALLNNLWPTWCRNLVTIKDIGLSVFKLLYHAFTVVIHIHLRART